MLAITDRAREALTEMVNNQKSAIADVRIAMVGYG
jgi:hypothetical protein